jgi:hypothetical protein
MIRTTYLGFIRVLRPVSWILGPQYKRSHHIIELDVTWECNLRCCNCNRSIEQAPTKELMSVKQVQQFVTESIDAGIQWREIHLAGGEPTLHPDIFDIFNVLLSYKRNFSSNTRIVVESNGHGQKVNAILAHLPEGVDFNSSGKESSVQLFDSFNVAPIDEPNYRFADFKNACSFAEECGLGLTPYGYYPCPPAGGIDRIFGFDMGYRHLPDDDDELKDAFDIFCRLCGHFKRIKGKPIEKPVQSVTWVEAYASYQKEKPNLTKY